MDPVPFDKILKIMKKFPDFNFNPEEKWAEFISAEPDYKKEVVYFRWRDFKQSNFRIEPGTKLAELNFYEILDNDLPKIYEKIRKNILEYLQSR